MRLALVLMLALTSFAQSPGSPEPPKLRLPEVARPLRQTVELTLVPERETFAGATQIELTLQQPTRLLWLNASQLTVKNARLVASGSERAARTVAGGEHFVGFAFDEPVGPGPARLEVAYEGALSRRDTEGLFAQQEGGDWYVFSQFEPLAARRAFPSFDEPAYKIPWTVRLRVPKDLVALSNAPETGSRAESDGTKTVSFAETPPMPSYLVAVAVGPFELVDAGTAGRNKTPLRIVTPRGKAGEARWAAQTTRPLFELLEDYFDIPYPYAKLDQIAIPITVAFGAMENAGLITYGQSILLRKPDEETVSFRRSFADIAAHELAHMWFGDLVTLAWWDDIWLNEAFASWMGSKVLDRWKPEWDTRVSNVFARGYAMNEDAKQSARRIRQPVTSNHDVVNAFDSITYSKGQVVLGMFESWLGEATFRKGVQQYLKKHSWGNATASDFVAALSAASGRDAAAPFATFLEQSGVPIVSAELSCAGGKPRLLLTQRPYRPIGSQADATKRWQIPVCVEHASAPGQRECSLLGSEAALSLANASSCPAWVEANDQALGYYRVAYRGELLKALLADGARQLTIPERVALVQDLAALAKSGDIRADEALGAVPRLLQDPSRHLVSATSTLVSDITRGDVVPEASRPKLARFLRESYGARARELGFAAKPGEDEDTRLLRATLLRLVAISGEDAALGAEAVSLARRWLADPKAIDPDVVEVTLRAAARHGDRALFDSYLLAARTEKDRLRRRRMLVLLSGFRDPELVQQSLAILLDPAFETRETLGVLFGAAGQPHTREATWSFFKQNYDQVHARTPAEAQGVLVFAAASFCDARMKSDAEAFLKPRVASSVGGPRNLAQTLEEIDLCIAYKEAQQASVLRFLERY